MKSDVKKYIFTNFHMQLENISYTDHWLRLMCKVSADLPCLNNKFRLHFCHPTYFLFISPDLTTCWKPQIHVFFVFFKIITDVFSNHYFVVSSRHLLSSKYWCDISIQFLVILLDLTLNAQKEVTSTILFCFALLVKNTRSSISRE